MIDRIVFEGWNGHGTSVFMQRYDLIDPVVSGNKLFKLKHNLHEAGAEGVSEVVTVGGAFSNHIAATAKACNESGFSSIGLIRGERAKTLNPTLEYAKAHGMQFQYVSRSAYRSFRETSFVGMQAQFPGTHFIPEGGANAAGVRGAMEMLTEEMDDFDVIVVPMGTGTTFAGLLRASKPHQLILGIPVLKNPNILTELSPFLTDKDLKHRFEINHGFHGGGYAKWNPELIEFIRLFWRLENIRLDPIYTGKMMLAVDHLLRSGHFAAKRVLCMHTGGLQGVAGFEQRFGLQLFNDA